MLQLLELGRGAFYYAGGAAQILDQRGAVLKRSRQAGNLYLRAAVEELAGEMRNSEQLKLEQKRRMDAEDNRPRKRVRKRVLRPAKAGQPTMSKALLDWLESCPLFLMRTAKGLTLADVGGIVNVTRQAVSNWEFGLRFPDQQHLERLGDLFERGPAYLEAQLNEWRGKRPVNLYSPELMNVRPA